MRSWWHWIMQFTEQNGSAIDNYSATPHEITDSLRQNNGNPGLALPTLGWHKHSRAS